MAIILDDDTQKSINGLIVSFNKGSAGTAAQKEFEIRLKQQVSHQDFSRFYTYLNEDNSIKPECTLDISVSGGGDNKRATISGEENIRAFCKTNTFKDDSSTHVISKQLFGFVDVPDYGFRVGLNTETAIVGADKNRFYKTIQAPESKFSITYRFKQRLSIQIPNQPFRFDLTIVKQSKMGESLLAIFSKPPTYEVECEFLPHHNPSINLDLPTAMFMLALMAQIRQECEYPIGAKEQQQVQQELAELAQLARGGGGGGDVYLGAKVGTLGQQELQLVSKTEYGVTDKADGERRLLYIGQNGSLFLSDIDLKIITRIPAQADKSLVGTILDGELLLEKTDDHRKLYKFYAFDILFFQGKTLEGGLRSRYIQLAKVISAMPAGAAAKAFDESQFLPGQLNCTNIATIDANQLFNVQLVISAKTYHVGGVGTVKVDAHRIWCVKDKYPYPLDGLIFTPYNDPYPYNKRTWFVQYKWKPPTQNSIDFEIQFQPDPNKPHDLYVADNSKPHGKSKFAEIILAQNAAGQDGVVIRNNTIVECVLERGEWVVLKTRIDKTTPNYITTADAIWKTIQNPVDEQAFCGEYYKSAALITDKEKSKTFRDFQNAVKKYLLETAVTLGSTTERRSLIDFSCGQGGDFHKWQDLQLNVVTGIDIHAQNLEQFIQRIRNPVAVKYFQDHVTLYVGDTAKPLDGQYLTKIDVTGVLAKPEQVQLRQHDIGASFFSVHYYFNNASDVGNFFTNAAQFIKPNGHLLITCLDGETVFNELNRRGTLEGKVTGTTIWKIVKQYDSATELNSFGVQIGFYMHTIFPEGTLKTECLVPFALLVSIAQTNGFTLHESKLFENLATTSSLDLDTDKTFAHLKTFKNWHRYYIFKRNGPVAAAVVSRTTTKRKREGSRNGSQMAKKPKLSSEANNN